MVAPEKPARPHPEEQAAERAEPRRWEAPTLEAYELACEVTAYAGRKRFEEEE